MVTDEQILKAFEGTFFGPMVETAVLCGKHRRIYMKTQKEIESVLSNFDDQKNAYPGMTYEQGIAEALQWVIGEISDEEFTPVADE